MSLTQRIVEVFVLFFVMFMLFVFFLFEFIIEWFHF